MHAWSDSLVLMQKMTSSLLITGFWLADGKRMCSTLSHITPVNACKALWALQMEFYNACKALWALQMEFCNAHKALWALRNYDGRYTLNCQLGLNYLCIIWQLYIVELQCAPDLSWYHSFVKRTIFKKCHFGGRFWWESPTCIVIKLMYTIKLILKDWNRFKTDW